MRRLSWWLAGLLALAVVLPTRAAILVNGAGATFPYPLYSKWFDESHKRNPDIQINYQSIGSGGGIRQVLEGTIDFGATDGPMTDDQLKSARGEVLHIPTALGAVAVTYNLPSLSDPLKLTPETLAAIFLGEITKCSDPKLVADNPGLARVDQNVVVVHCEIGSAPAIARALDRVGHELVVGTLAGDDTLLVVARDSDDARALARELG